MLLIKSTMEKNYMGLTKETMSIINRLYKEYLKRRKSGISRDKARNFASAEYVKNNFFPNLSLDDIDNSIRELNQNKLMDVYYADNKIWICKLSNYGISFMEALPRDNILNIADFISKFIP